MNNLDTSSVYVFIYVVPKCQRSQFNQSAFIYCWTALIIFIFIDKVLHFCKFLLHWFSLLQQGSNLCIPQPSRDSSSIKSYKVIFIVWSGWPYRTRTCSTWVKVRCAETNHTEGQLNNKNTGVLLHQRLIYSRKGFPFQSYLSVRLHTALLHTPAVAVHTKIGSELPILSFRNHTLFSEFDRLLYSTGIESSAIPTAVHSKPSWLPDFLLHLSD